MKYFSMFSGIAGFELGIERAANNLEEAQGKRNAQPPANMPNFDGEPRTQGWGECATCVGYSEIDKYAIQIFRRHFPDIKNYGDATKIKIEDLPDFVMLCGGFPCQTFSIAGKRMGFDDTRGTLFFEIARIAKAKKPQILFLENVKGLLSHDGGRTFATILATLDELGYNAEWECLNSKNFGVPQNRERVFIIGHLRGKPREQVFPLGQNAKTYTGENECVVCPTLSSKQGHNDFAVGLYKSFKKIEQLNQPTHSNNRQPKIAQALQTDMPQSQRNIRRLTPIECERLQAFPDDWTKYGINDKGEKVEISDTQRYKMCGNAVTVNVIQAIAEKMLDI